MKVEILIDNMKCGGCADTIKNGLKSFPGVLEVEVDIKKDIVSVIYNDGISVEKIKEKLSSMGYPAKNTLQGFDKLTANAKSYLISAIGKVNKGN